jgi:hypothetical protein
VKIHRTAPQSKAAFLSPEDLSPGTWLRDNKSVRSHHLSGYKDSGYTANSIAFGHHTASEMKGSMFAG